jgi:hypothetical protein
MSQKETVSPQKLLEIGVGFQRSKTLFALVELKIPTLLKDQPLALDDLAEKTKIHPLALDRLLNAAVALELLQKRDDETFANSETAARYLVEDTDNYLGEQFLFYQENSYPNWQKLTEKLREWQPGINDRQESDDEDQEAETLFPQHNLALLVGKQLARSFDFSRYENLLDVGGGTGAMSLGICAVHRDLHTTVWDLPAVLKKTARFVGESDLSDRVKTESGNFKEDRLPAGFDCVLLANLLSVASEETNREFFKRIYDSLPTGGAVVISGWILDDSRTAPEIAVLFCLEDVINQVPDVERTERVYRDWLENAGFKDIRRETYLAPYSFIVAVKN